MTTEERLLKLEGIVEAVVRLLPERITSLEGRLESFRQELRGEIQALRGETKDGINALRQEVKGEMAALRQEVEGKTATLREEIATLRQEVKAEINTGLNRLMLVFTGLGVVLALLTLLR